MSTRSASPRRDLLQTATLLVGVVFILVAILGFVPGITTPFDQMMAAGHESHAKLLGIFQVSVLHNVVHLLFGIAGIALARTRKGARGYLIGGGVIYLVLTVFGLVIDQNKAINFVPINSADNVLHAALGVGMIGLGMVLSRTPTRTPS